MFNLVVRKVTGRLENINNRSLNWCRKNASYSGLLENDKTAYFVQIIQYLLYVKLVHSFKELITFKVSLQSVFA
jgi:hypothetical protein